MSSGRSDAPPDTQEAVFRFLADPKTHGLSEPVERVDTAAAVVFLAGAEAYKVKRAVKFPFMDLSTLAKRREACEAEIAVNRAAAPQIYLTALPITRRGRDLALGGDGELVEWVVHMRRFDENATLDHVADRGGLSDAIIDKLAVAVHRSHARAPLRDGARAAHALETYIEQNTPLSRSGRICSTRRRRGSSPSICGLPSRFCARSCSSAARPVSFVAVTAICTCATSFSSTASRLCSTRWSFPTKLRAGTFSTIWLFC